MDKKPALPIYNHYPVIIISDFHLGMKYGASGALCEFLEHTHCDKLILNGDIIDGRLLNHRDAKEIPESQKRILDALNRKIAEGTEVIYIPGNHDIELREMGIDGKTFMGVRIEPSIDFTDAKGRKFLILHGDQFDKREERTENMPEWFLIVLGRADEILTAVSGAIDKLSRLTLKTSFQLARRVRGVLENDKRGHREVEQAALKYAKEKGYNGVICGHIHVAAHKTKDGMLYLNSGDWIDSFSALAMHKDGGWEVIEWQKKRKEMGLRKKFRFAASNNPDKAFRPATDKMIEAIKRIWPGKKNKKPRPGKNPPSL